MFGNLESSAGRDIVSTIQSDGSRAREIVSSGSLRTAAFVSAIEKIALSYMELGIFP